MDTIATTSKLSFPSVTIFLVGISIEYGDGKLREVSTAFPVLVSNVTKVPAIKPCKIKNINIWIHCTTISVFTC